MSRRDGKNPKFRLLCKRCNSYLHTTCKLLGGNIILECAKCGAVAYNLDEERE